jgi:hypothetical protein
VHVCPTRLALRVLERRGLSADRLAELPPAAGEGGDTAGHRARIRRTLGIPEDQWLLVAPDEMIAPAGHRQAVWVHSILRVMGVPVRLAFARTGRDARHVHYAVRMLGDPETTIFADGLASPREVLAAGDVALFGRLGPMSLTAVAETLAAGVPWVGFRAGQLPQFAADGAAGLLAEPGNVRQAAGAVLRLLETPELRTTMGQTGRSLARERFSAERIRAARDRIEARALSLTAPQTHA